MWVGLIQSVEVLTRTKKLTVPLVRGNSICLMTFELRSLLFSCLQTQTETLGLKPAGFQTGKLSGSQAFSLGLELHQCPPARRLILQILWLASVHNHMSQFLIINRFPYLYTSYCFCFPREPSYVQSFKKNKARMINNKFKAVVTSVRDREEDSFIQDTQGTVVFMTMLFCFILGGELQGCSPYY